MPGRPWQGVVRVGVAELLQSRCRVGGTALPSPAQEAWGGSADLSASPYSILRAVGTRLPQHQPGSAGILPGLPGCWEQQLGAVSERQEGRPLQAPAPAPTSLQPALKTAAEGTDAQPLAEAVKGNTPGLAVQELPACYSPTALPALRGPLSSQQQGTTLCQQGEACGAAQSPTGSCKGCAAGP